MANGESMSNWGCTTERNFGYAIWYAKFHKLLSRRVKKNTNYERLSVLDGEDKINSRFFQLKAVPRSSYERPIVSNFTSPVTRNLEI